MSRNAVASRWPWDIRGMTRQAEAPSSAELERGFDPVVGEVLAVIEALGVDAEQHLHAMTSSLGDVGGRYSRVEPERYRGMPQVVLPPGERGRDLLGRQGEDTGFGPHVADRALVRLSD